MVDDVNEQVFNEKQLYTGDVLGEDEEDDRPVLTTALPDIGKSAASHGITEESGAKSSSSSSKALTREEKRKKKASVRATQIMYWLESKYELLFEVCAANSHWKAAPSFSHEFDLFWCDTSIAADRFTKLKPYQKMNHFVGMSSITRKNNLGRNLLRMRKQFPTEYRFFPDTWILPTDLSDFKLQFTAAKNKTFIVKPDNGCQGKGIFLVRDSEKVPVDFSTTYVAQRYIHRPFLLDNHKFDLRLYVLVMGCDPLRIFLHKRGLVRLATETYVEPTSKNLSNQTVHLTNYAINKMSPNYEENVDPDDAHSSHKRSWEAVFEHLRNLDLDVDTMMQDIEDLIVKTLIAVQPSLSHFYHSCQPDDVENSMCFEILGFDVILDHKLQPWLLEVNHAPSFAAESELDRLVKHDVLSDTMNLLHLNPETRRRHKREAKEKMEQRAMGVAKKQSLEERSQQEHDIAKERTEWEDQHLNGYKRLYPSEAKERQYNEVHDAAINIWEMLMGGNSRRSVRLTQQDPECTEEKGDKTKKGDGAGDAPVNPRERRSADEMREVVERLTAGCSARPRESCKPRRRGNKQDSTAGSTDASTRDSTAASTNPLGSDEDGEGGSLTGTGEAKPDPEPKPLPRPEVQVGDVIKVQTNLGWEAVTVKAKRTNGKIDIQFKDGEYMRSVLPRILREIAASKDGGEKEKDASEGTQQASSSSAPAPALPKTARVPGGKDASSTFSAASKIPSLPAAVSAIDHARAAGAAAAAAAVAAAPINSASYGSGDLSPFRQFSSSSPSAAVVGSGASSVIAAAANAIAGTLANNFDLASINAPMSAATTSTIFNASGGSSAPSLPGGDEEASGALSNMSSLASKDNNILSMLQKQRARSSNAAAPGDLPMRAADPLAMGGDSPARGSGITAALAQQAQSRLGTGLRPPGQTNAGPTMWMPPNHEPNKVHEVRLRNHLQQLICVRPIVTRRNGSAGADETPTAEGQGQQPRPLPGASPKSPRTSAAARRSSGNPSSVPR